MKQPKNIYVYVEENQAYLAVDRKLLETKLNLSYTELKDLFERESHFRLNNIDVFTHPVNIPSNRRKISGSEKGRPIGHMNSGRSPIEIDQ